MGSAAVQRATQQVFLYAGPHQLVTVLVSLNWRKPASDSNPGERATLGVSNRHNQSYTYWYWAVNALIKQALYCFYSLMGWPKFAVIYWRVPSCSSLMGNYPFMMSFTQKCFLVFCSHTICNVCYGFSVESDATTWKLVSRPFKWVPMLWDFIGKWCYQLKLSNDYICYGFR